MERNDESIFIAFLGIGEEKKEEDQSERSMGRVPVFGQQ
jgi:hypothetical protein